jgi:hypothetical protein
LLSFSPVFTWDSSTRYTIRICSVSLNLKAWITFDYEGKILGHDTLPQCIKSTLERPFFHNTKVFPSLNIGMKSELEKLLTDRLTRCVTFDGTQSDGQNRGILTFLRPT